MGPYWQVFAHIGFTERFAHVKSKIKKINGACLTCVLRDRSRPLGQAYVAQNTRFDTHLFFDLMLL